MKNILKICTLFALAIVPMSAFAQSEHAIKTKDCGGSEKVIHPKPNGLPDPNGARVNKIDALTIKQRIIQSGCDESVPLEPNTSFIIKWEPPEMDSSRRMQDWMKDAYDKRIRVWQLMQGQDASSGQQPDNLIATWSSKKGYHHYAVKHINFRTVPCAAPYSCDFVWDIQAVDDAGKEIGERQIGSFKMTVDQQQISNEKIKPWKGETPNHYFKRLSSTYNDRIIKP